MVNPLPIEPGAPVAKDAIDPDLIRLSRPRPTVGLITAAGLVFLCGYFLVRLTPDRHFAANAETPQKVTASEILGETVSVDRYIQLEAAQPLLAHAVRTSISPGSFGLRVIPIRGSADRIWIAMPGDGWERPGLGSYIGRLRRLAHVPFAEALARFARKQPRPTFAIAAAVREGLTTGTVRGIADDPISVADGARVAFDVVDANAAMVVGTKNERLPSPEAWAAALTAAGITTLGSPEDGETAVRIRVQVENGVAGLEAKLEAGKLWAARGEPVTRHYDTTWGELKQSPPHGFRVGDQVVPADPKDLIGIYLTRVIPSDAYVLIVGEHPDNYWYVQPITIGLGLMAALFGFALFRAVKRDLLPTRA